jgi:hypothetical protein
MPSPFQEEASSYIKQVFSEAQQVDKTSIFQLNESLFIHLIPLDKIPQNNEIGYYEALTNEYAQLGKQLIHLWEDHWIHHRKIIISRLASFARITTKIHGRKTKVIRIHQEEFYAFLIENHLQGAVHSKYKFGLYEKEKLVAVAGFSHPRKIPRNTIISRSSELIRFCNLRNHTVIGGMDKLLKHFITHFEIDDIMSYADRDWSNGKSYERLGFDFIEKTPPTTFWVNLKTNTRHFEHILSKEIGIEGDRLHLHLNQNDYLRIENSGNLKFIKHI